MKRYDTMGFLLNFLATLAFGALVFVLSYSSYAQRNAYEGDLAQPNRTLSIYKVGGVNVNVFEDRQHMFMLLEAVRATAIIHHPACKCMKVTTDETNAGTN